MKFSIRREANLLNIRESLGEHLRGVPIELALPYRIGDYLQQRKGLPDLVRHVKETGIAVQSVHATQGHLTDPGFMDWGLETVRLAEELGAGICVFHPESFKLDQRTNRQVTALQNIKRLQRETAVVVAVETFGNKKRVLTPEEIAGKKIPMILDTSHLFRERTMQIIDMYHSGIAGIHLSEERHDEKEGKSMPHMPVKDFGFQVLDKLREKGWNGPVTLEYLPWYHDRLQPDMKMLEERYGLKGRGLDEIPVSGPGN